MKKILAVLLCAMLVSSTAAFTASAYDSPELHPGDSDTDPRGGSDDESGKPEKNTDTDKTSSDTSKPGSAASTSPKTGAPVSYGVLMAAAALAFGSIALSSKKKIEEE